MHVVIAGGHGQIALLLERRLADNGDDAVGLVRNVDHVSELEELGAHAAVVDLEESSVDELVAVLNGSEGSSSPPVPVRAAVPPARRQSIVTVPRC